MAVKIKTREYLGKQIRFVERDGSWWAVGVDVCNALGYENSRKAIADHVDEDDKADVTIRYASSKKSGANGVRKTQSMTIISEPGIYSLIFGSKLPTAKALKRWVCEILVELRKAAGLEGLDALRLADIKLQKDLMARIKAGLKGEATPADYIKANTIANKATSNRWGFTKMVNKGDMPQEMLADREEALNDTVELLITNRHFNLGLHISKVIYDKYSADAPESNTAAENVKKTDTQKTLEQLTDNTTEINLDDNTED